MSNRELVFEVANKVANKLPEDNPLEDIQREIAFVAGVKETIAESNRGAREFRWMKRGDS
jgi:hypothetical protein